MISMLPVGGAFVQLQLAFSSVRVCSHSVTVSFSEPLQLVKQFKLSQQGTEELNEVFFVPVTSYVAHSE